MSTPEKNADVALSQQHQNDDILAAARNILEHPELEAQGNEVVKRFLLDVDAFARTVDSIKIPDEARVYADKRHIKVADTLKKIRDELFLVALWLTRKEGDQHLVYPTVPDDPDVFDRLYRE